MPGYVYRGDKPLPPDAKAKAEAALAEVRQRVHSRARPEVGKRKYNAEGRRPKCGSPSGAKYHRAHNEPIDELCKEAERRAYREQAARNRALGKKRKRDRDREARNATQAG